MKKKSPLLAAGFIAPLLLMGCTQPTGNTTTNTASQTVTQQKDTSMSLTVTPPAATQMMTEQTTASSMESQTQGKMSATENDLLLTKVKLAVLSQLKSEDTFQDPADLNKFVFVTRIENQPEANELVGVYDVRNDATYHSGGDVSLDPASTFTYVYTENLPNSGNDAMTFYAAGMDESKLVLWETGVDNSPGPCFNMWLGDNGKGSTDLTYIDINDAKPVRKAYIVPQEKIDAATKEQQQCEKDMQNGN